MNVKAKKVEMDLGTDRAEPRYSEDGSWQRTRVLKGAKVHGSECSYESDGQLAIEDFPEWGPKYALGNDKEFEEGI